MRLCVRCSRAASHFALSGPASASQHLEARSKTRNWKCEPTPTTARALQAMVQLRPNSDRTHGPVKVRLRTIE